MDIVTLFVILEEGLEGDALITSIVVKNPKVIDVDYTDIDGQECEVTLKLN